MWIKRYKYTVHQIMEKIENLKKTTKLKFYFQEFGVSEMEFQKKSPILIKKINIM